MLDRVKNLLMESNRMYHYLFKYGLLGVSILLAVISIVSWFAPELITVNEEPGTQDISNTSILAVIAVLAFLFFLLIRDRFVIVELGNQSIKIKQSGQEKTVSWLDVEQVKLIPFVYPPLYKLRSKDNPEAVWFNTEPHYIGVNGFVSDLSEMGDLIKKKKRELNI